MLLWLISLILIEKFYVWIHYPILIVDFHLIEKIEKYIEKTKYRRGALQELQVIMIALEARIILEMSFSLNQDYHVSPSVHC